MVQVIKLILILMNFSTFFFLSILGSQVKTAKWHLECQNITKLLSVDRILGPDFFQVTNLTEKYALLIGKRVVGVNIILKNGITNPIFSSTGIIHDFNKITKGSGGKILLDNAKTDPPNPMCWEMFPKKPHSTLYVMSSPKRREQIERESYFTGKREKQFLDWLPLGKSDIYHNPIQWVKCFCDPRNGLRSLAKKPYCRVEPREDRQPNLTMRSIVPIIYRYSVKPDEITRLAFLILVDRNEYRILTAEDYRKVIDKDESAYHSSTYGELRSVSDFFPTCKMRQRLVELIAQDHAAASAQAAKSNQDHFFKMLTWIITGLVLIGLITTVAIIFIKKKRRKRKNW